MLQSVEKFTEGLRHDTWDISCFTWIFYGLKWIQKKLRTPEICSSKMGFSNLSAPDPNRVKHSCWKFLWNVSKIAFLAFHRITAAMKRGFFIFLNNEWKASIISQHTLKETLLINLNLIIPNISEVLNKYPVDKSPIFLVYSIPEWIFQAENGEILSVVGWNHQQQRPWLSGNIPAETSQNSIFFTIPAPQFFEKESDFINKLDFEMHTFPACRKHSHDLHN